MISGRTHLRAGVSGAKFDAEADFEVCLPLVAPKPCKNNEKRFFNPKLSSNKFFWRREMKRRELSETRFGQVSRRSEACLWGKRPLKVSKQWGVTLNETKCHLRM